MSRYFLYSCPLLFHVPPVYLLTFSYTVLSEKIKGLKFKAIFAIYKISNSSTLKYFTALFLKSRLFSTKIFLFCVQFPVFHTETSLIMFLFNYCKFSALKRCESALKRYALKVWESISEIWLKLNEYLESRNTTSNNQISALNLKFLILVFKRNILWFSLVIYYKKILPDKSEE